MMVVAIILAAVIAGTMAAVVAWILGYGLGVIALAYWMTGNLALLLTASLHVLFSLIGRWWWMRLVEVRFRMVLFQSAASAAAGVSILGLAIGGIVHPVAVMLGAALLLSAPVWLTVALGSMPGEPEPRRMEDYL